MERANTGRLAGKIARGAMGAGIAALAYLIYSSRAYLFTTPGNATASYKPRGIDRNRLAEEGVDEDTVAKLDPRDGGNIAPDGEVLYLDENRLKIREKPDRPLRRNHATGLGMKDRAAAKMSAMMAGSENGGEAFANVVSMMGEPAGSAKRRFTSEFLGFEDSGYTHVQVIPLDVDLSSKSHNVILPVDLIVQELKDADYIAILHQCICRDSFDCKHYPHDFGCIFLGPVGRHAVEKGIARHATLEEALEHVHEAAELGLMAAADFVEGEQFIWGVRNDEMNRYRMICFCCDCCCLAMKVLKESTKDVSPRYAPVGWTATVNHDACVGCGACRPKCPQKCISYREDGKCIINQDQCLGCGFCKLACGHNAIGVRQTMPMRASLHEYYLAEGRIDDGLHHAPAVESGLLSDVLEAKTVG